MKICLLGMHRSGTSVTASWFQASGIPMSPAKFLPASEWNRKGHFEDLEFVRFHERIIRERALFTRGWKYLKDAEIRFSEAEQKAALRIVAGRGELDTWGWKDPRTCVCISSWKETVPDLQVVAVWRKAESVVRSLTTRSRFAKNRTIKISLWGACRIWYTHNLNTIRHIERNSATSILLNYDHCAEQPRQTKECVERFLGNGISLVPYENVYDSTVSNSERAKYRRPIMNWLMRMQWVHDMESRLKQLEAIK